MFVPLKGYVSQRVRVSEDVLPFRPVRGMHVTVSEITDPHGSATEDMYRWYDRIRLPQLVSCEGVAGAWTFYSEWTTFGAKGDRDSLARYRIMLLFLDGDPDAFLDERASLTSERDTSGVETVLLDSPLRPIDPWQWDWFDNRAGA